MVFSPKYFALLTLLVTAMISACKTTAGAEPRPALLTRMDQTAQDTLTQAVSKAIGSKVTLAADSFMTKPSVTIEPASVNKRNGRIIDGRTLERPSHVDLMMMGAECYVMNRETGEKIMLEGVDCKPLVQDL
ncbi:hypothetical protein [Hellea balneolensis]|uniref:hypothetical protein n=1 Tax=Hellea balneolensis TaxID=287478 RepID=UPI000427476D|nr:hypothetical protein [Hellea balneolensis]